VRYERERSFEEIGGDGIVDHRDGPRTIREFDRGAREHRAIASALGVGGEQRELVAGSASFFARHGTALS
jgi:hypothetical protein